MLRLQRYLVGELLAAFALVLLIFTGILLAGSLLQILQKIPELSVLALLQSIPLFLGLALPISVPFSFLLACLLTYGRFADDNEFTAFQMAGVSPRHAVAPAVCAAAFVSIGTLVLCCDVNPMLTSAKKSIVRVQVREQVERMRSPAATNVRFEGMEMSWNGRDGEWYIDPFVTWTTEMKPGDGAPTVKTTHRVTAKRATVKLTDEEPLRLVVTLEDVTTPADGGGGMTMLDARRQTIVKNLEDEHEEAKSRDEMRASELWYHMVRLEPMLGRARQSPEWRSWRNFAGEYWQRVALGLSPLAFGLLGVPLGLLVRRGSRAAALVIGLVVGLPVYYPLLLWGSNLSRSDVLPPALALNLGNLVLGGAGVVMTWRLCRR